VTPASAPTAPAPAAAAPAAAAPTASPQPPVVVAPSVAAMPAAVAAPVAPPVARTVAAPERARPPVAPAAVQPPAKPAIATIATGAPASRPTAATLDLAALEQRLRDTHAVGVFTKLSLKNQVDDLLDQFRSWYRSKPPPPLTPLRQRYDLLLLKVLTLLQDGDPPLAAAISSSREAIWGILSDPQKFSSI